MRPLQRATGTALAFTALLLTACSSGPGDEAASPTDMASIDSWCQRRGFVPPSEAYDNCVAEQVQRLEFTRQQIFMRRGG